MSNLILKNEELLHEYYAQEGHKYPELNLQQFKDIVYTPYTMLRKEMENGNLEIVRLKYFGTFQVFLGRAVSSLRTNKQKFSLGKLPAREFFKYKDMLERFIKNHD
jgi:hypothetical protein